MDFSTEFVALRDRMRDGQGNDFICRANAEVAGRTAALLSSFDVCTERKLLGIMPTGGTSRAHEYRLLFGVPVLDAPALDDWWRYAIEAERALVRPDASHSFSLISLLLAAGEVDRAAQKKLKKLEAERQFAGGQQGWSAIRAAAVELGSGAIYVNRMGQPLKSILRPFLSKNT